jgi:plasmid stabilization system protein ParE
MKLRLTPRALAEAKRIKTWWRQNRRAAPHLFEQELKAALALIRATPGLGIAYQPSRFEVPVRRVLLPRT